MRPLPEPDHDPLAEAHAELASGRPAAALERILERIDARTGSADRTAEAHALASVARAATHGGDLDCARSALEAALGLVDWADLHHALGVLLVRLGEHDGARRELDRALAINPQYRAAMLERALLDAREGRFAEAAGVLREWGARGSTREAAALREGLDRLRAQSIDDAIPFLREAFAAADTALEPILQEAQERFAAGETGAALELLRRAVSERPGYPDLHAWLGAHELRSGHVDDGIASLSDAICLNPSFHAARLELARGLEARGDREAALAQVRLVLSAAPGHEAAAMAYERLAPRTRTPAGPPGSP